MRHVFAALVPCLLLSGCGTSESEARPNLDQDQARIEPLVRVFEKYRERHGEYPPTYRDLVHKQILTEEEAAPLHSENNTNRHGPCYHRSADAKRYVLWCSYQKTRWMGQTDTFLRSYYSDEKQWHASAHVGVTPGRDAIAVQLAKARWGEPENK